ncbi:hydrophobic surface binding protein A-domain-containing protein [Aspergillus arachidicola]|uniref:Hydrophobic surface binding protein A-domain-containing protein n=1 Tax=Aspergillus arachidicola TaxID=656916 RepID=A0A2G7FQG0_9EURO|nr:hydrophobic surface binding protein A-domain-containing protein [Aspergillus arachidicola]PIG82834.1 hypothetical protein AARAC_003165 [Aspergillus arachidicola]
MVFIAKLLVLALTAAATPILRRDATTVQNDITQKMGPQITQLNNDVSGFPASGLTGALAINNDVQELVSIVKNTISDIQNTGSFGTVSGTTILADIQNLVPTFLATLVTLDSQYEAWAGIPGGTALVLSNLQSLNTVFTDFTNAVNAAEPFFLKPGGIAIQTQITAAFTTAIAEYSV